MKLHFSRLSALLLAMAMTVCLLAGCGGSANTDDALDDAAQQAGEVVTDAFDDAVAADPAVLDTLVEAIEVANPIDNPFVMDDMYVENSLFLTMDNIVAYRGKVTNNGDDCALIFAALVKDGTADTVKDELAAHKESASSNLYAEFADKVAKAQDAIITSFGNVVVYIIAGVNCPDYAGIEEALAGATA